MGILLDTGFLYALVDQDDNKHEEAQNILKETDWKTKAPIISTALVVNETYTLLLYRSNGNADVLKGLDPYFWREAKFFRILPHSISDYREIRNTMGKFCSPSKKLSFVDASLIHYGMLLKIKEIASFDGHFDGIFSRLATL